MARNLSGQFVVGRLQVEGWEEWSEWFRSGYNWRNFHFIELAYELESYVPGHEFSIALLGLCARITWYYGEKNTVREP